jgi:cytochrome c
MRWLSSLGVLGLVMLGCSSSDKSGSSTTGAPRFTDGDTTPPASAPNVPVEAAPTVAEPGGAASGSGGPPGSSPPGGNPQGGSAGADRTEATGAGQSDLPLAPGSDPDPMQGTAEPSSPAAAEGEPMPPVVPPTRRLENVLVFTRTTGFRHDSIEPGVEALQRLGRENAFAVERTEDPADFTDERLARYDVVIWLNTDSEVLNENARRAFERYIRAGGGWVGVHAASATEYGWAWYGQLLGGAAFFRGHPAIQPARVAVEVSDHASTEHLPQSFTLQDEWYSFRTNPRSSVRVLMTLDESSYSVGELAMGDHPIAWYHEFDGGRAWYTALGHPNELYVNPLFTRHLLGGIRWAAGVAP